MIINEHYFLKELRQSIHDDKEPFCYSDDNLKLYAKNAVMLYSKYNPIVKKGHIETTPNITKYSIGDDYQTWTKGLEDYTVYGNNIYLEKGFCPRVINFEYIANRSIDEIPECDIPFIIDYCVCQVIEDCVNDFENYIAENNDNSNIPISSIKLGRGLDVTFENVESARAFYNSMAQNKRKSFIEHISGIRGVWV